MDQPNEKRNRARPTNIIFNLVALALLLTVIVFLHQILKKPKEQQTQQTVEVKAIAALPAIPAPAQVEPQKEPAPAVELEKPAETYKEVEPKPAIKKEAKKTKAVKRTSFRAEQEIAAPELDGEQMRQRYIEENRRLSSGSIEKPSSSYNVKQTPDTSDLDKAVQKSPSYSYDLDDETARQKYLEENRRLSRVSK